MMSCYDQNFGKPEFDRLIALKAQKLGTWSFYKRMYYRVYQNAKYVLGKIANKARLWFVLWRGADKSQCVELLKEIRVSREILQKKLKNIG